MLYQFLFAVSGGPELIDNAAKTTDAITKGWDNAWQQTIVNAPVDGSYWQVVWVASWIANIGCLIFIFNRAMQLFSNSSMSSGLVAQGITFLLVPLMIWAGLTNHAVNAANISYAINRVILYSNQQVMQTQVASTTFSDAVKSMNLTTEAQTQLRQEYQKCMNIKDTLAQPSDQESSQPTTVEEVLEKSPQYQCFKNFQAEISKMKADFESKNCSVLTCNGVTRLFEQASTAISQGLSDGIDKIKQQLAGKDAGQIASYVFQTNIPLTVATSVAGSVGNYLAGSAIQAGLQPVLYAFQFDYMNTLVGGMFLCGMSAPIALASALIPFSPRSIWVCLISFFSFGLAIFLYDIFIGTAASLIVAANAETFTELQYAFFLGLFAPAISTGLATFCAWKAAQAAQANGHALASATFSITSSVIMSILRLIP